MTITTDFDILNEAKAVTELAIKIRADLEYMLRVLEEQITSIGESMKQTEHTSIVVDISTEEDAITDKS